VKTDPDPWPAGVWRHHLAEAVRNFDELLERLDLDAGALGVEATAHAARRFPLRVPRGFVARMRRGDPEDPLLRQVLPVPAENEEVDGFSTNPVGELGLISGDGLLSKYHGRALVIAAGACAIHCRYCFRRHFPYDDGGSFESEFESALQALADDPTIEEVILSGGDPLMLPDDRLATLTSRIADIPHVRRLRLHTRMPVVLPERVDEVCIEWVAACSLPVVVVVHANHPREIDDDVARALRVLRGAGASVLNQAVLLAGVNDSVKALADLSIRLFECGVLPYYLHLLDRVAGAAHFEVDQDRALEIMSSLRAGLPGYLVPRLVREIDGAPSKVVVG
jgi:EF-P beta-lysylation protein EpmB